MKPQFMTQGLAPQPTSILEVDGRIDSSFRHARDVEWAKISRSNTTPEYRKGRTPEQHAGIQYELQIQKRMNEYIPKLENNIYTSNTHFTFKDYYGIRNCELDGIWTILDKMQVILVEIKLRYYPQAKEKTRFLYEPVLRSFLSNYKNDYEEWKLSTLLITKILDPSIATDLGGRTTLRYENLTEAMNAPPGSFGVYEWNTSRT